jgi:hypothetical protein
VVAVILYTVEASEDGVDKAIATHAIPLRTAGASYFALRARSPAPNAPGDGK